MTVIAAGFMLGISIIAAIGPQNALLIKMGIQRNHIGLIVAICLISDVLLIFGGTAGVGVLVERFPAALTVLKYAGAAYLIYFAFTCFRDSWRGGSAIDTDDAPKPVQQIDSFDGTTGGGSTVATKVQPRTKLRERSWVKPALTILAFTWINPVTYIDVLVMLGGIANQYGDQRWLFATGAVIASSLWFPSVGFGAARFSGVLSQPKAWRVINFAVGCIMVVLVAKLLMM